VTPALPTRYARSGEACIAYQVMGEGPLTLVNISGPASHLDLELENPLARRGYERLASFTRFIRFDRRGTGLSDPVERPPTLEQQMDDLHAVMDDVGVERAALFAGSDAGLGALFAATHPDRVSHLVLWGVATRVTDCRPETVEVILDAIDHWGTGGLLDGYAPGMRGDARYEDWWIRNERATCAPSMARKIAELNVQSDVNPILPTIRVPTLMLHRTGDRLVPVEVGKDVARRIPNARFVEIPGVNNYGWAGDWDTEVEPVVEAIEEFLTGSRRAAETDRVLATVVFTDIVDSTARAAELGDRRWRELLERHDAMVREQLERWRGREVKSVGDGFLATFDGPTRAVRCAQAVVETAEQLGLRVRTGVHAGECEVMGEDVGGIAVHIGARVAALAGGGEVLVSSTVRDLVAGSGIDFEDRGTHALKGVPGDWRLYRLDCRNPSFSAAAVDE